MLFLSLYHPILIPILSEWIDVIDLCYLDTAMCNSEQRNYLTTAMMKCTLINMGQYIDRFSLYWIKLREMGLGKLDFTSCNMASLQCFLSPERSVAYLHCRDDIPSQLFRIKGVASLCLEYSNLTNAKLFLHRVGHTIVKLYLRNNSFTSEDNFALIASCCPNLTELEANEDAKVLPVMFNCDIRILMGGNLSYLCHNNLFQPRKGRNEWYWSDRDAFIPPYITLRISTLSEDESTLLIAGKRYHLIGFRTGVVNSQEQEFLSKLACRFESYHTCGFCMDVSANFDFLFHHVCNVNLKELNIGYTSNVVLLMEQIAVKCPLMERLSLLNSKVIPKTTVSRVFEGCPYLIDYNVCQSSLPCSLIRRLLLEVESFQLRYYCNTDGDINFTEVHRSIDRPWKRLSVVIEVPILPDMLLHWLDNNTTLKKLELYYLELGSDTIEEIKTRCSQLTQLNHVESSETSSNENHAFRYPPLWDLEDRFDD